VEVNDIFHGRFEKDDCVNWKGGRVKITTIDFVIEFSKHLPFQGDKMKAAYAVRGSRQSFIRFVMLNKHVFSKLGK